MELKLTEIYSSAIAPYWSTVLGYLCLVLVFQLMLKKYLSTREYLEAFGSFPTVKLRCYDVFGHLKLLVPYRLYKYPQPSQIYLLQVVQGIMVACGKGGVALGWQMFFPYVFVYKAKTTEAIVNNSVELKKAQPYKFLSAWIGDGLLISNGSKWRSRRKILTPAFHFHILKDFLPVLNKKSKIFVEVLRQYESLEFVNIVSVITRCSFDIICESILGAEMNSQTEMDCKYLKSVTTLTESIMERFLTPWLWPDLLFNRSSTGKEFHYHRKLSIDLATQLILQMKQSKIEQTLSGKVAQKDEDGVGAKKKRPLLDLLLDEHLNNNSISLHDIREEVDTFMFEGHDTTSMGMSWTLYLIGLHPDVQSKLHVEMDAIFGNEDRDATMDDLRDMKYLECVIKESLRLYPPVPMFGRFLQNDIEYDGLKYPKGCQCVVMAYCLHRDPEVFQNPEKFDPERFFPENSVGRHPFAYVPFSAGPRNCIGQKFALMEEKCVISSVLRNYTIRSLDSRDKVHPVFDVVLRPLNGLRLEIRRRQKTE